ncbi:MAG: hypothetical protein ACOYMH_00015 [Zwartia sp.]
MKQVFNYNGESMSAYQAGDLLSKSSIIDAAKDMWYQEWVKQSAVDEGTCCGGKAIQVVFLGKGCRKYEMLSIVLCSFVQGNVAAAKSVKPVLEFLEINGIKASYYDGWMD